MATPEYCLLWIDWWPLCMQKSEWASWVQAFGALAALSVAVWLQKSTGDEQRSRFQRLSRAFCMQVVIALDDMQLACRAPDEDKFKRALLLLEDALQIRVNYGELDPDYVHMVMGVREYALIASSMLNGYKVPRNWVEFDGAIGNISHDVRKLMAKTGREVPAKNFSP